MSHSRNLPDAEAFDELMLIAPLSHVAPRADPADAPAAPSDVDQIAFAGPSGITVGRFRCAPHHPSFRDSGPIRQAVVVFPRTSVRIRHEGSRDFVADPTVVTLYNRAQRYARQPVSPDGDRCDWFGLPDALAHDIAVEVAPHLQRSEARPFGALERAPATAHLYHRQRTLFARIVARRATAMEVEEETMTLVASVLALAAIDGGHASAAVGAARRRELAEATRATLAVTMHENRSVIEIARMVGASPFHLCRTFKAETGMTMHAYRVRLRLARALENLEARGRDLSSIAHELGFASHAHFTRHCRDAYGVPPSAVRAQLALGE